MLAPGRSRPSPQGSNNFHHPCNQKPRGRTPQAAQWQALEQETPPKKQIVKSVNPGEGPPSPRLVGDQAKLQDRKARSAESCPEPSVQTVDQRGFLWITLGTWAGTSPCSKRHGLRPYSVGTGGGFPNMLKNPFHAHWTFLQETLENTGGNWDPPEPGRQMGLPDNKGGTVLFHFGVQKKGSPAAPGGGAPSFRGQTPSRK